MRQFTSLAEVPRCGLFSDCEQRSSPRVSVGVRPFFRWQICRSALALKSSWESLVFLAAKTRLHNNAQGICHSKRIEDNAHDYGSAPLCNLQIMALAFNTGKSIK